MNQQAIEAAADELNRVLYPEEDIPKIGKIREEYSRHRATKIIEAARPHLEADFRQKIAEEIRAMNDVFDAFDQPLNATQHSMKFTVVTAARIVEGKQ